MNAVAIIYKRVNDPKKKKQSLRRIIRNWAESSDYKSLYNLLHEPLKKSWTDNTLDKHIRNLNEIWISKKGKYFREVLKENNGLYPIKYMPKLILMMRVK